MTMNELKQKLDCDIWDLWDSVCNALPMNASSNELAQKFAETYGVEVQEVMEYFGADEYDQIY